MRTIAPTSLALLFGLASTIAAQQPAVDTAAAIRSATSAAPASLSSAATVMDLEGNVLRPGTNGWVCMPDNPGLANDAPMCLDQPWLSFVDAMMNKRQPSFTALGIGYMLQGDMPVSNTDPFASGPTADNQWIENSGPHIMLIVPDARLLEGIPVDPTNGGPWVMWAGTPYAHIMVPAPKQP